MSLKVVFDKLAEEKPEAGHPDWNEFVETYRADLFDMLLTGDSSELAKLVGDLAPDTPSTEVTEATQAKREIVYPLGGQWLLDPAEINGWSILGPIDNTNTQDLGNVGAENLSRVSGGLCFPWPVKIKEIHVHWYVSSAAAQAFGFVLARQAKKEDSNVVETKYVLDQIADNDGVGPIDPSNTNNQQTTITIPDSTSLLPARDTLVLGVAAPTARSANTYVRMMSGYILMERV